MHWSSMELLESNNLLAGWSGFELRSTPLQSKKITSAYYFKRYKFCRLITKIDTRFQSELTRWCKRRCKKAGCGEAAERSHIQLRV